jgi:hypothetical protein
MTGSNRAGRSVAAMACAHASVKGSRTRIGLNDHPNSAEISGPDGCPSEQQATDSRSQQRRLDKELQQVSIRIRDFDLNQSSNSFIALGYLKVGGLEFVGMQGQFSSASSHERVVVSPNSL